VCHCLNKQTKQYACQAVDEVTVYVTHSLSAFV